MTQQANVEAFLNSKTLALAGASSGGKKFGNAVLKELSNKGYKLLLVHPKADTIEGHECYPSLAQLPETVGGLVLVVPPAQTDKLVREAHAVGITKVWMQQGSASPEAVKYCEENGISVVSGECILMFAQPQGLHRFHHWLWGLLGKLPKTHNHS